MTKEGSHRWARRKAQQLLTRDGVNVAVRYLRDHDLLPLAAQMLAEAGHTDRAIELYVELGDYSHAAKVALAARRLDDAARLFEEGGDLLGAARILERARHHGRALQLYMRLENVERVTTLARYEVDSAQLLRVAADFLQAHGQNEHALEVLVRARCYGEAAAILLQENRAEEALALYEKHGLFKEAAQLHKRRKEYRKAAYMWLKAGDFEAAAQVLISAHRMLLAARLFRKLGDLDRALATLDAVHPSSAEFREAMLTASVICEQAEDGPGAASRLERLLAVLGLARDSEDVLYRLVDLYLDMGNMKEAEELLDRAKREGMDPDNIDEQISRMRDSTSEVHPRKKGVPLSPNGPGATSTIGFPRMDRYLLVQKLARGGHGVLFLVQDKQLDRTVVLKLMHMESMPTDLARQYFMREARSAARLDHPNIVRVFDVGEAHGCPYYTMEYVRGYNLYQLLQVHDRTLTMKERLGISIQLGQALAHAHNRKVLHRDVKMENVMVGADGKVKLLDFGLAKALDENPHASLFIVGTPQYMSPEQLRGEDLDGRTDLFALGVLLFRLFTGSRPFGDSPESISRRQKDPPPDPRSAKKELPERLAELISSCLEPNRDNRPATADDVVESLREIRRSLT